MIRVVIYLVIVALLSFAAVWFADRPGDVLITWQDWRIETSVLVLVSAFAAVAVAAVMVWSTFRAIVRSPAFAQNLVNEGAIAVGNTPAEFAAVIRADLKKWAAVIKEAGIKGD